MIKSLILNSEGTTTWVYDTAEGKGIGKVHTVTAANGSKKTYSYTALGAVEAQMESIPDRGFGLASYTHYISSNIYDDYGRLVVRRYPVSSDAQILSTGLSELSEVAVKHVYDSHGTMYKLLDASNDDKVHWELESTEANGSLAQQRLNGSIVSSREYDAMGRVSKITSSGHVDLQNTEYRYDGFGNLE